MDLSLGKPSMPNSQYSLRYSGLKIDNIQAHRFGQYLVINITISVDGEITVRQGHETANEVEKRILENLESSASPRSLPSKNGIIRLQPANIEIL